MEVPVRLCSPLACRESHLAHLVHDIQDRYTKTSGMKSIRVVGGDYAYKHAFTLLSEGHR